MRLNIQSDRVTQADRSGASPLSRMLSLSAMLLLGAIAVIALVACLDSRVPPSGQSPLPTPQAPPARSLAMPSPKPAPPTAEPATSLPEVRPGQAPVPEIVTTFSLPEGIGSAPIAIAIDPESGYVYVANQDSNDVSIISGTEVITTVRVGERPNDIIVNPKNGYVYVANTISATVTIISGTQVIKTLSMPGPQPYNRTSMQPLAVDPDTGYVYVANDQARNVVAISGTEVIATLPMDGLPRVVKANPRTGYVYASVLALDSFVAVISGTQVVASLPTSHRPEEIAVNPATGYVYVASGYDRVRDITIISGTEEIATLSLEYSGKVWLTANPVTGFVYATVGSSVAVIRDTEIVTTLLTTDGTLARIQANPATGYVYAVASDSIDPSVASKLVVLSDTQVITTIATGTSGGPLEVNPRSGYVYMANCGSDNVTVLDGLQVVVTIPSTVTPLAAAVNPTNDHLYVVTNRYEPDQHWGMAYRGDVVVISGTQVIATVPTSGRLWPAIAVDPTRGYVFVVDSTHDEVVVISDTQIVAVLPAFDTRPTLGVNPTTSYVYVPVADGVMVIDGTDVLTTIDLDHLPHKIESDPVRGYVYVMNLGELPDWIGSVSVLSGTELVGMLPVGEMPVDLAVVRPANRPRE